MRSEGWRAKCTATDMTKPEQFLMENRFGFTLVTTRFDVFKSHLLKRKIECCIRTLAKPITSHLIQRKEINNKKYNFVIG